MFKPLSYIYVYLVEAHINRVNNLDKFLGEENHFHRSFLSAEIESQQVAKAKPLFLYYCY